MSDDMFSPIFDANRSVARKRLVDELRFLFRWQTVALLVAALGLSYCTGCVLLTIAGTIAFYILAFWTFYRLAEPLIFQFALTHTPFLPDSIHNYARFGVVLLIVILVPVCYRTPLIVSHTGICLVVFLLYSIVPQFFIARWLAKEAEADTM